MIKRLLFTLLFTLATLQGMDQRLFQYPDAKEDYVKATNTKNALMLGLMFTPAWIALGGFALVELVWFFLKDKVESSHIELYLYKSLLFNTLEHNEGRTFNGQEGTGFKATIFKETLLTADAKYKNIDHFTSSKAVRAFIATTYEKHPELIKASMQNELSQLKSIVHGISLSVQGATMATLDFSGHMKTPINNPYKDDGNLYYCYSYVALSKNLATEQTHFIQLHNGQAIEKQKVLELDDENNIVYNTMWDDNLDTMQALGNMDATEIIVATKEVSLKYKVVYEYKKQPYGNENYKASADTPMIYMNKLTIKELKLIPMTADDFKLIK